MNEINNSPTCERASDLVAFLYHDASESETRNFELHLKECGVCRQELASFGVVRESITAWRDEALSGFVSIPLAGKMSTKSAVAALRQFFDLSPLWLKGATGFAVIVFCLLAVLAVVRLQSNEKVSSSTAMNPKLVYTEQDVDRIVKEALAKQENGKELAGEKAGTVITVQAPKQQKSATVARNRRPLSRAEREQLAADLRLLSPGDDTALNLLGDRINQ
jgi:hypothetical protein